MKKNYTLLMFIAITIGFCSCESQSYELSISNSPSNAVQILEKLDTRIASETPLTIVKKSQDIQFLYVRENLKIIAEGILKLSGEAEYRDFIRAEVGKRFDGDDNVLINTLLEASIKKNARVNAMATQLRENKSFKGALNAFIGIEGQDYYPQIHIPFYEVHEKAKTSRSRTSNENIVIVLWDGNEVQTEFPGYKLEGENLVLAGITVNEEYARNNEIWVFSLNERNGESVIVKPNGRKGANSRTTAFINAYIENMTIRTPKETWIAGRSDVYINGYTTFWNGVDPVTGQTNAIWNVPESNMVCIAKVDHNPFIILEIERTYNFQFNNSWDIYGVPTAGRGDWFPYVIYEHDNWPISMKSKTVSVGSLNIDISFRSADPSYVDDKINYNDISTYVKDVPGQIKINTRID